MSVGILDCAAGTLPLRLAGFAFQECDRIAVDLLFFLSSNEISFSSARGDR